LCPQAGDWYGDDPIGKSEDARAGVEDDASRDDRAQSFGEPFQVSSVGGRGSGSGFDLDGDQLAVSGFDEQVDLMPAVRIAIVEQTRRVLDAIRRPGP